MKINSTLKNIKSDLFSIIILLTVTESFRVCYVFFILYKYINIHAGVGGKSQCSQSQPSLNNRVCEWNVILFSSFHFFQAQSMQIL